MGPCTSPGHPEADLDTEAWPPNLHVQFFNTSQSSGSPGLTGLTGKVSGSEIL